MIDPTARELIQRLADELDTWVMAHSLGGAPLETKYSIEVVLQAHAYLAQPEPDGPAVPDGRELASVAEQPTDAELLELMPETMRDEFSYAATVCSDATGGQVKPGIFRVALNTAALEYASAVLTSYGSR